MPVSLRTMLGSITAAMVITASTAAVTPGTSGRELDHMIRYSPTGLVVPQRPIDADLELKANRTRAWVENGVHRMLLEGGAEVAIGTYAFGADRLFVMITPRQQPGLRSYHLAIYLDQVTQIGGRGPVRQQADRLLVTAAIKGEVKLSTDLMTRIAVESDDFVQAARGRIERYRGALERKIVAVPDGKPLVSDEAWARREATREQVVDSRAGVDPQLVDRVSRRIGGMVRPLEPPAPAPEAPAEAPAPPGPAAEEAQAPVPKEAAAAERQPEPPAPAPVPAEPAEREALDVEPPLEITGHVDFTAGKTIYETDEEEGRILLLGGLRVMYTDPGSGRSVNLLADRGMIFVAGEDSAEPGMRMLEAAEITGVYLEDNAVVTDGDYTLRGPRVFYDFRGDRALVLNAVFYTWEPRRKVPIYVRAERLRQHSLREWSANQAVLSTSEFHEPHFAVGVDELRISEKPTREGGTTYAYEASGVTPRIGNLPVFYWPGMKGKAVDPPIRSVRVGHNSDDGVVVKTEWDLFALTNIGAPDGFDATLSVDGFSERGAGTGIDARYDVDRAFGEFDGYYLYDVGEDSPGGRDDVEPPTEHRGKVRLQHRHYLSEDWEMTLEAAWVSDPTFLEEFFTSEANTGLEYETHVYLKHQEDDAAFTFQVKHDLLDFVPQTPRLQTAGTPGVPGYTVDKFPEIAYHRIATPLFDDTLTWYSENRVSVLDLNLPETTPGDHGFSAAEATALLGIMSANPQNTRIRDEQIGAGLPDSSRLRGDTRQELALPLTVRPFGDAPYAINVVPYVVGRVTGYDDDFAAFAGESDAVRFWGATGVKLHTSLARTYPDVESRLLDLHRLRHVIEPSVNLFFADSSIDQADLPVYDYGVESITEGLSGRFGLRNTLQTQRGGPGHWHSVDVLRVDTDFIVDDTPTQRESSVARFFDHRPELSLTGDHFFSETAWQVSDTLALLGNVWYSFDSSEVERWNVGLGLDHTPRLSSFVQVRSIDDLDTSVIRYGVDYLLTKKYHVSVAHSYDLDRNDSRVFSMTLTRRMPRTLLLVTFNYDSVDDSTSVGVALVPEGFGGRGGPENNPFLLPQ